MDTVDLAKMFDMPHKSLIRIIRSVIDKGMFSQSDISKESYVTKQNKTHVKYNLSDCVVIYLASTVRAFRSTAFRVDACAKLMRELDVSHRVVIGDATRKELAFGSMLESFLGGIEIISQHFVNGYYIDFYIPTLNIAIEYDERHHNTKPNKIKDAYRMNAINQYILDNSEDIGKPVWVRVDEGFEVNGLGKIMEEIVTNGLEVFLPCMNAK